MGKESKKSGLATGLLIGVIAVIIAVVAYKQVFLVSRIVTNFPEAKLTAGLQACMQESLTPDMLKKDLSGSNLSSQLGSVLGSVWSNLSTSVVKTTIKQNYVNELKVLGVQDFLGENAEIRVTGSVDLVSEVPVVGKLESRKDYTTTVVKHGAEYHFDGLSVKKPESQQWDQWTCTKTL